MKRYELCVFDKEEIDRIGLKSLQDDFISRGWVITKLSHGCLKSVCMIEFAQMVDGELSRGEITRIHSLEEENRSLREKLGIV
jgi:hypothetical protein